MCLIVESSITFRCFREPGHALELQHRAQWLLSNEEPRNPRPPPASSGIDLFLPPHPWDFLAFYPPTIAHPDHPPPPLRVCCPPTARPIQSRRVQSLDPTVWICLSHPLVQRNTQQSPSLHVCQSPLSHMKGERGSERRGGGGVMKTKKNPRKQLHAPPLSEPCASGFPAPESVN